MILSLRYALGHIDVSHAQQSNHTIIVRFRGTQAIMNECLLVTIIVALTGTAAAAQASTKGALIARAKSFELDTPYVPPPGDSLTHHAAGFAKVMCSAVFMTGLAPDFAAENVGFFTGPYGQRAKLGKPVIDRVNKAVHVTLPNGVTGRPNISGARVASRSRSARAP